MCAARGIKLTFYQRGRIFQLKMIYRTCIAAIILSQKLLSADAARVFAKKLPRITLQAAPDYEYECAGPV
jgi:hypothetical protein